MPSNLAKSKQFMVEEWGLLTNLSNAMKSSCVLMIKNNKGRIYC